MKPSPPKTPKHSKANISSNTPIKDQQKVETQNDGEHNDLNLEEDDDLLIFSSPRSFRGHTIKIDKFGSATPSWTIGSSRQEPRQREISPGPTEYDISDYNTVSSIVTRNQKKKNNLSSPASTRTLNRNSFRRNNLLPTSRSNFGTNASLRSPRNNMNSNKKEDILKDNRTITSNIDLYNLNDYYSTFGNLKRSRSIGIRKDTVFWTPTQSPPVIYELNTTLSPRNIRIGKRIYNKVEEKLGPGTYDPSYELTRINDNQKLLTISKSSEREVFHIEKNGSPGPGEYEVIKRPRKAPTWFKERRVTKPPNERDESSYASSRISYRY